MLYAPSTRLVLRALCVFTLLTFFPSAVQAWQLLPLLTPIAGASPGDGGTSGEAEVAPPLLSPGQLASLEHAAPSEEAPSPATPRAALRGLRPAVLALARVVPDTAAPAPAEGTVAAPARVASLPAPARGPQNPSPAPLRLARPYIVRSPAAPAPPPEEEPAPVTAVHLLSLADGLATDGAPVAAVLAYLSLMDAYPQTLEYTAAAAALEALVRQDVLSDEEEAELDGQVPWVSDLATAGGKLGLVLYHQYRAINAQEQDDSERALLQWEVAADAAWQTMQAHPAAQEQITVVTSYLVCEQFLGGGTARVDALAALAQLSEALSPSLATWRIRSLLEGEAPALATLASLDEKDHVRAWYYAQADQAEQAGDTEASRAFFAQARDAARTILALHPDRAAAVRIALDYANMAHKLGEDAYEAAMGDLMALRAEADPCMARFAAHFAVGDYLRGRHDRAGALLEYGSLLDDAQLGYVAAATESPQATLLDRAWVDYATAHALFSTDRISEAVPFYQGIVDVCPEAPIVGYRAAFERAFATAKGQPFAQAAGIAAYQDFLDAHPDTDLSPLALLRIGALYHHQGAYESALTYYGQVIDTYPDSPWATTAFNEWQYVQTYHVGSIEVPQVTPEAAQPAEDTVVAQHCGPRALQRLLRLAGIESTTEELAALAGTNETGTSMQGLVEAAAAKGVTLIGVEAQRPSDLAPPYIAHVEENHFVLVTATDGPWVTVVDEDDTGQVLPLESFAARWRGKALVQDAPPALARLMDLTSLKGARGGYSPPADTAVPPPCYDGNCAASGGRPGFSTSPTASTGISSPGVHPLINLNESALNLHEVDLRLGTQGATGLTFTRSYMNELGFHRPHTQGTTDPWNNNIGDGWTHSLNVYLRTSTGAAPTTAVLYDGNGTHRNFYYSADLSGYLWYFRTQTGTKDELSHVLTKNKTTGAWTLEVRNGNTYTFSALNASRFARLESYEDQMGNTLTYEYDGAVGVGHLTKVLAPSGDDRNLKLHYVGNLITKVELCDDTTVLTDVDYEYDGNDELTKVTDPAGNAVQYEYDSDSNDGDSRFITKITDKRGEELGLAWTFSLNGSDWEASGIDLTNAAGLTTEYTRSVSTDIGTTENYDATTLLARHQNTPVSGDNSKTNVLKNYTSGVAYHQFSYEYEEFGGGNIHCITKQVGPGSVTLATLDYDNGGRVLTQSRGTGPDTVYAYATGHDGPTKVTAADGLDTTMAYGATYLMTKMTHPALGAAGYQYVYDAAGQPLTMTTPDGHETLYAYDGIGQMTASTNPVGATSAYAFDAVGHMTASTDPNGNTTSLEYDLGCGCGGCAGTVTKVTDASGAYVTYEYDENGNKTKETDAEGVSTCYGYDAVGQMTGVTSPCGSGNAMTLEYDLMGQLTKQTDFEGGVAEYEYDLEGRQTKVIDPESSSGSPYITYEYDDLGQQTKVIDGRGMAWTYEYDAAFQLTKVTDPESKVTKYVYDTAGRAITVGAGAAGTVDYTAFLYDGTTGLLTQVAFTDTSAPDTRSAYYAYDEEKKLTQIRDWIDDSADGGLRYAYDDAGRVTSITDYDDSVLSYVYDDAGNVVTMNDYHSQVTAYAYDERNWMTRLTAPGTDKVWNVTYRDNGQRCMVELPPGDYTAGAMYTTYSYDNRNRLTKVHHDDTSSLSTNGWVYRLDANGNILRTESSVTGYGQAWDYAYDGRHRLTDAILRNGSGVPAMRFTYAYDAGDNLLTKAQVVYDEVMSDDFSDGDYTSSPAWTVDSGTWSAASGELGNSSGTTAAIHYASADDDGEVWFSYKSSDLYLISGDTFTFYLRYDTANTEYVAVEFTTTEATLREYYMSSTTLDTNTDATTSYADGWYDVYARFEGSHVEVWRGRQGEPLERILSGTTNVDENDTGPRFAVSSGTTFKIDNVRLLQADTDSEGFTDDFSDGDYTSSPIWSATANAWQATNEYMEPLHTSGNRQFSLAKAEGDRTLAFRYYRNDASAASYLRVMIRHTSTTRVEARFYPGEARISQYDGANWSMLDQNTDADTDTGSGPGDWHDVKIVADGSRVEVWRKPPSGTWSRILSTDSATVLDTTLVMFYLPDTADFSIDDIVFETPDSTTVAYEVNDANEMTKMTEGGTSIYFDYDECGRTVSKYDGTYSADYYWHYGIMLTKVVSDFPGEGTVDYEYGGNGERRSRSVLGGDYTWYNWDADWTVLNEETQGDGAGDGLLSRTYVVAFPLAGVAAPLAHFDGVSPTDTAYVHYLLDLRRDVRGHYTQSKTALDMRGYTPLGQASQTADGLGNRGASASMFGQEEGLVYTPYRYYAPDLGLWLSRDPMRLFGGAGNPYNSADSGLMSTTDPLGAYVCVNGTVGREVARKLRNRYDTLDVYSVVYECRGYSLSAFSDCFLDCMGNDSVAALALDIFVGELRDGTVGIASIALALLSEEAKLLKKIAPEIAKKGKVILGKKLFGHSLAWLSGVGGIVYFVSDTVVGVGVTGVCIMSCNSVSYLEGSTLHYGTVRIETWVNPPDIPIDVDNPTHMGG